MQTAYLCTWTETEKGWGSRPDGCSIHLTRSDYNEYVKKYWKNQPKEVPYEYSRPNDNLQMILINEDIYLQLQKEKSLRYWQFEYSKMLNEGIIET